MRPGAEDLVSLAEAAPLLGRSPETLSKWPTLGLIVSMGTAAELGRREYPGRTLLYRFGDLEAAAASLGRPKPKAAPKPKGKPGRPPRVRVTIPEPAEAKRMRQWAWKFGRKFNTGGGS